MSAEEGGMPHWPQIDTFSEGFSERQIDNARKQKGVEKALEDTNKPALFSYLTLKGEDPANIAQFKFRPALTGPTTMAQYKAQAIKDLVKDEQFRAAFKVDLDECLRRHNAVDFEKLGADVHASIEERLAKLKIVSDMVEALLENELDVGNGEDAVEKKRDELTKEREEIARRVVKDMIEDYRARTDIDKLLKFKEKAQEPGEVAKNARRQRSHIDMEIESLKQSVKAGEIQIEKCKQIKAVTFESLRLKEKEYKRLIEEMERVGAEHLDLMVIHGLQRISLDELGAEHAKEQNRLKVHEVDAKAAQEKLEDLEKHASLTQSIVNDQATDALAVGTMRAQPATKAGFFQKKVAEFVSQRRFLMAEEKLKATWAGLCRLDEKKRKLEAPPLPTGRSGMAMKKGHERKVQIMQVEKHIDTIKDERQKLLAHQKDIEEDIDNAEQNAKAFVALQEALAEGAPDEEAIKRGAWQKVDESYPDPTCSYSDLYDEDPEKLALPAPYAPEFSDETQLALPRMSPERPEDLLRKLIESEAGRKLLDTQFRQQLAEQKHALQVRAHVELEGTAENEHLAEVKGVVQTVAQQDMQELQDAETLAHAQEAQDVEEDKEPTKEGDAKDAALVGPSFQANGSCGNGSTSDNHGGTDGSDGEEAEDTCSDDFEHVGNNDV